MDDDDIVYLLDSDEDETSKIKDNKKLVKTVFDVLSRERSL